MSGGAGKGGAEGGANGEVSTAAARVGAACIDTLRQMIVWGSGRHGGQPGGQQQQNGGHHPGNKEWRCSLTPG